MAYTVEDGSIVSGANGYVPVSYADEYHADRNRAAWVAATNTQKETALILAADYVDARYSYRGEKLDALQSLAWPRDGAIDDSGNDLDGIPEQLKRAVCEYALRALSGDLAPDPTADATGGFVIASKKKVGPLETETQYAEGSGVQLFRPYPIADRMLRELRLSGLRIERA